MKKLKTILQSKFTYIFLFIFIILYVLTTTVFLKYDTALDDATSLEGIITELNISEDKISFILKSSELIQCNYYLKEDNSKFQDLLGKKIRVAGVIGNSYNNTIPNTFNYKKYLYNKKIYTTYKVSNIEILQDENILYKIKKSITNLLDSDDEKVKAYLNLLILGDNAYLDDENYNNYRINGIWHLFAISGMHISIIVVILNKLLSKIKFKNLLISLVLFYFMFLTNFAASILRATIFFYLKTICEYLKINMDNKKVLFLTAFIILLFDPFMIYNVGFQYSFLITYAIMHESDKITGNYFKQILKISIISFVVSLPITVSMNYEINLLSILLNIIYVPFITFIVFPISIITAIFPFFEFIFKILIYILEYSNELFEAFNLNIIIPKMNIFIITFYYLFLLLYSKLRYKIFLIISFAILLLNQIIPKLDKNYYVYYLDVGQGDSSILVSPYKNEVIMVDTGGLMFSDYHISDNIITFLKSKGIGKVDLLVISHGDYDHMGEAINLVENFKVEKVIFNNGEYNDLELELIEVLEEKNVPYYQNIKELNIDDNKLYFLIDKLYDNENDNSLVIYTELNNYKFLFMGDAGVEAEEDLLEKYNLQDIDVLKVGHHGSKTSSGEKFIDSIEPKYSVISVGRNNRYGHPNDAVLDNLENSKIYRTDQDGSVVFKINKNKLNIETCTP